MGAKHQTLSFKSLKREGQSGLIEINKSRFHGYALTVNTEEEAHTFIREIAKRHPESSCICHAYIIGMSKEIQRFHDGHEPVGGMPILENIKMRQLTNVVCAVSRYYGGVKLGAGNLARYFSKAASQAIDDGVPSILKLSMRYRISFDYGFIGKLQYTIEHSPYIMQGIDYGEKAEMTVLVPNDGIKPFTDLINGITNANHEMEKLSDIYYCWD